MIYSAATLTLLLALAGLSSATRVSKPVAASVADLGITPRVDHSHEAVESGKLNLHLHDDSSDLRNVNVTFGPEERKPLVFESEDEERSASERLKQKLAQLGLAAVDATSEAAARAADWARSDGLELASEATLKTIEATERGIEWIQTDGVQLTQEGLELARLKALQAQEWLAKDGAELGQQLSAQALEMANAAAAKAAETYEKLSEQVASQLDIDAAADVLDRARASAAELAAQASEWSSKKMEELKQSSQ